MTEKEKFLWILNYVQPLFDKHESIPTDLKYMFIEKDYTSMFGKSKALDMMKYMYEDTETFIFAFDNAFCAYSKTVKKNLLKKYFEELALSIYMRGEYSERKGRWKDEKQFFINLVAEQEAEKDYINLLLV